MKTWELSVLKRSRAEMWEEERENTSSWVKVLFHRSLKSVLSEKLGVGLIERAHAKHVALELIAVIGGCQG